MSLSVHQSACMKSDQWLTPPEIMAKLGRFDLDQCSPENRLWPTAERHITAKEDGLSCEWHGRVWCNPPFGREAVKWLRRMAEHGDGIALVPARTETAMFFEAVWDVADAVLFIEGRPHFYRVDGTRAPFNSGAPICLIAYGATNVEVLERCGLGYVVPAMRSTA